MLHFAKKPIAVAVSASMLVMGVAQAAPALRGTQPVLVTSTTATLADLFSTKGAAATGTLNVAAFLTIGSGLLADLNGGPDGNGGTAGTAGEQDFQVYTDDGTTKTYLGFNSAAVYASNAGTGNGIKAAVLGPTQGAIAFNLTAVAGAGTPIAFRANPTTNKLEYSADNNVTAPTWLPVKVALVSSTTAGNRLSDGAGVAAAGFIGTAQDVTFAVAPTPKVSTRDADANGLLDGYTVNTYTALGAVSETALTLQTVAIAATGGLTAISSGHTVSKTTSITAAPVYTVDITSPSTVDWTDGNAAADTAAYAPAYFNTGAGSAGSTVPYNVDVKVGSEPTYSTVYRQDTGAAAQLAAFATGTAGAAVAAAMPDPTTATDGASPVLLSATANTTKQLALVISEPLSAITVTSDDLREIAENVAIGSDSLAALNLNAGGALSYGLTAGTGANTNTTTLTLDDTSALFAVGQSITVKSGIGLAETNDNGYTGSTTVLVQDTLGGLKSDSTAIEGAAGTKTAVGVATDVKFADCKATAQTLSTDGTKVATVTCAFKAGNEIAFAAGKSATDLVNQIYVRVDGTGVGGAPVTWDFYPTAVLNAAGDSLVLDIPTDLVYANVPSIISMDLYYLNVPGGGVAGPNVLVAKASATDVVDAAGPINVSMPLAANSLSNTLYTQSIKGTISGANDGSLLKVYIARWLDKAVNGATSASTPTSGRITNAGDKVATDLALMFGAGNSTANAAAIATLITAELAKDKPALIPVYIQLQRSNDIKAAGGNSSGQGGENGNQDEHYLEARAIIASASNNNQFTAQDPVYQVMLDPKTGNISGRLTGKLDFKTTTAIKHPRGLVFLDANGDLTGDSGAGGGAPVVAEGLIGSGGAFNMIVGVDSKTQGQKDYLKDAFLLLVLKDNVSGGYTMLTSADPGATNFTPFAPNLVTLKGERTNLGTITLSKFNKTAISNTANWQLLGAGHLDRKAGLDAKSLPRFFVGLDGAGLPGSNWTEDTFVSLKSADLALTMLASKTGLATEGTNFDTTSTIGTANYKANAMAFAFASDNTGVSNYPNLWNLVKADDAPTGLPIGWSLIRVPTDAGAGWTTMPTGVEMVINVGANAGTQYTWVKGDAGSAPAISGKPVFVYVKTAVTGK